MGGGRDRGASAQDHLAAHELAVVLAQGAGQRLEAGITEVGAGGPLPAVAEKLGGLLRGLVWILALKNLRSRCGEQAARVEQVAGSGFGLCRDFPFELGR